MKRGVGVDWRFRMPEGMWERMEELLPKWHRSKLGGRPLLTEGAGVPIGVAVSGANTHDMRLAEETLASVPIKVPDPDDVEQHLCLDKGYDDEDVRKTGAEYGYPAPLKSGGDDAADRRQWPKGRARRWVVERTHSWMNRFRRLLVRWEKKADNYLALIHLACAFITYSAAEVLG